jgi:hypothetical protein
MKAKNQFIHFFLTTIFIVNILNAQGSTRIFEKGRDRLSISNNDSTLLPYVYDNDELHTKMEDSTFSLLEKPAIPLLGIIRFTGNGMDKKTIREEDAQVMLKVYQGLHVPEGQTTLNNSVQWKKMTEANPDFMILPYSSSTVSKPSMGITKALEEDPLNLCSFYLEGNLVDSIEPETKTFRYKPTMNTGCGLKAATASGEYSENIHTYIFFIRIGDEIMRVEELEKDSCILTVERAYKNTEAASHAQNAMVMGPVYRGKRDVQNPGTYGVSSCFPDYSDWGDGSVPQYHLRLDSEKTAKLVAAATEEFFQSGCNGLWLDLTSPGIFVPCNAYGIPVKPWNFELEENYTQKTYMAHQERKIQLMREEIIKLTGKRPYMVSNNHANGKYFYGNGMDLVRPTEQKPDPIEGVILEGAFCFYQTKNWYSMDLWSTNLKTLIHGAQNKYPVWPWIKSMRYAYLPKPKNSEADRFQFFDYTSTLLGYEPNAGIVCPMPAYEKEEGSTKTLNLPDYLFYDIGQPLERVDYNNVNGLRISDKNTFRRQWSKALIYVNPTDKDDDTISVPSGYFDPDLGKTVTRISMPAHTGKILLLLNNVEVDSVALNYCPNDELIEGAKHQLSTTVYPQNATNKVINWSSSDPSVLRVDQSGRLTAIAPGKAIIKATTNDGAYTDECAIEVIKAPISVSAVNINDCPYGIHQAGDMFQLTATVLPDDAADNSVSWSSSDTLVATVDESGLVGTHKAGNAYIRVTANDIGFYDECLVLVDDSGTTDVKQIGSQGNDIKVYPNPVSDELHLEFMRADTNREITIFNCLGQKVFHDFAMGLRKRIEMQKIKILGPLFIQIKSGERCSVYKVCVK